MPCTSFGIEGLVEAGGSGEVHVCTTMSPTQNVSMAYSTSHAPGPHVELAGRPGSSSTAWSASLMPTHAPTGSSSADGTFGTSRPGPSSKWRASTRPCGARCHTPPIPHTGAGLSPASSGTALCALGELSRHPPIVLRVLAHDNAPPHDSSFATRRDTRLADAPSWRATRFACAHLVAASLGRRSSQEVIAGRSDR